jgi:hypothetical protein
LGKTGVLKLGMEGVKMRKSFIWKSRMVLAVLAALITSSAVAPARADDVSAGDYLDSLNQAIAVTQDSIENSTRFSFLQEYLVVDWDSRARKGSTRLVVTPTVSEYFQSNFQSVDNQASWQTDFPLGMNHVYVTSNKVYSVITKDQSWGAGYSDFSIQELKKASPFTATWVISDVSGPNQNRNAMDPIANSASYIEGLGAGPSYLEGSPNPPVTTFTKENGDIEYTLKIDLRLTYVYTVSGTTGLVKSFLLESVLEGTNYTSTYSIAIGNEVAEPVFDPGSLNSIEQTAIVDIARGLTAQSMLSQPANLLIKITTKAASKLRKKVTVALLRDTAKKLFIQSKLSSISGGIKLTGSYQGKAGYMCVYVKNAKLSFKGCNANTN